MAAHLNQKSAAFGRTARAQVGGPNDDNLVDRVADFSYQSDALAQLIVEMWLGHHGNLITPVQGPQRHRHSTKRARLRQKQLSRLEGIYLQQPIVLTEIEYDGGFSLADANLPSWSCLCGAGPSTCDDYGCDTSGSG